jgi:UDP-glucose 4-epimerase
VYGPRADVVGSVASVIPRWLDRIDRGEPFEIYGDGAQTMDFIYVTEVARANILACRCPATHDVFNVGSGVETSANELADSLLQLTGSPVKPVRRPEIPTHVRRRCADTRRAEQILNFTSRVTLPVGLRSLLAWRREYSDGLKKS